MEARYCILWGAILFAPPSVCDGDPTRWGDSALERSARTLGAVVWGRFMQDQTQEVLIDFCSDLAKPIARPRGACGGASEPSSRGGRGEESMGSDLSFPELWCGSPWWVMAMLPAMVVVVEVDRTSKKG